MLDLTSQVHTSELNYMKGVMSTNVQVSVRACNAAGCSAWKGPVTAGIVNN